MDNNAGILFIPEGCSPDCPILQSSQAAALSMAAEAQALFQGFLKTLNKLQPNINIAPESKRGANMMEYFTCKMDQALVNLYDPVQNGFCVHQCDNCPYRASLANGDEGDEDAIAVTAIEESVDKQLYDNVVSYNERLQSQCQALQQQVNILNQELAKRRSQYNNRLLIHIFEDQYKLNHYEDGDGSFFDIVPRERLADFIPFLRNIVLGPAISQQFDEQVELLLERHKDEHGHVPVGAWDDVLADQAIAKLMAQIAAIFYERSQHRASFRSLVQRKSPVNPQKFTDLIYLFESLGLQHELEAAG